jgi:hypothetical protein
LRQGGIVNPHQPVTSRRRFEIGATPVYARMSVPGTSQVPSSWLGRRMERENFSQMRFVTEFRLAS